MRVTQVLNLRKRVPVRRQYECSYPIPFQALHPLELGDRYTNLQANNEARPCVSQLTVLLQCFKDSDFNQKRCAESLKNYYTCIEEYAKGKATSGAKDRKLHDVKRVRDLTQLEASKLLKSKPIK
ncbi:uncharacterized protein LOC117638992 [Thrips palmi]|uniref:Uncharacterized protein LOC117638992 n=1 Tax=Thrips palmi TaxID=161013 RepID=A0A6P8Y8U8_THRPL|nr:uncharacterized protein LOC117638992 [Thrips palmi]